MSDSESGQDGKAAASQGAGKREKVEETPAEVMGLPPKTNQPAPRVEGGSKNLPPAIWPEGE